MALWVGLCLWFGCRESQRPTEVSSESLTRESRRGPLPGLERNEPIAPIAPEPDGATPDPALVALGAELFESPILSEDGQVSCRSCHDPGHGFADAVPRSMPAGRGRPLAMNTPSLLNVGLLQVFNWNGRHASLGEHLDGLIQNPLVHATTWASLARRLRADEYWSARFARAVPGGVEESVARSALLAYERSLLSPGAPFDRWLTGEADSISGEALQGYELFKSHGCVSCHQGMLVGGNLFQRLGVIRPYYTGAGAGVVKEGDLGRFDVTGREEDRFVFRVPSLRNVARTAPYLHDGSLATLDSVVSVMATYQLGRPLAREQIGDIVAFLETLTAPSPQPSTARSAQPPAAPSPRESP
jgi:cytochrome c peroxidase